MGISVADTITDRRPDCVTIRETQGEFQKCLPKCARMPEEIGESGSRHVGLKHGNDQLRNSAAACREKRPLMLLIANGLGNEEELAKLFACSNPGADFVSYVERRRAWRYPDIAMA